jgi:dolichol-phosphate mannosyltransferase
VNAIVVVPTYNERDNLPELLQGLLRYPALKVLIVDDQSPDGTGQLAEQMARDAHGRIEVLHRTGRRGFGRSLLAGLSRAIQSSADFVFQMDADLSHDPKYLAEMMAAAAEADLVIGSRYVNGVSVVNWPLRRIILSAFANQYVRAVTRLSVRDCTSGFRCWRRDALARLPMQRLESEGYSLLVEMLYLAERLGCRIVESPIIFVERRQGVSKMSSRVMLESALTPWRLLVRRRSWLARHKRTC